eukprot:gene977-biopygen18214
MCVAQTSSRQYTFCVTGVCLAAPHSAGVARDIDKRRHFLVAGPWLEGGMRGQRDLSRKGAVCATLPLRYRRVRTQGEDLRHPSCRDDGLSRRGEFAFFWRGLSVTRALVRVAFLFGGDFHAATPQRRGRGGEYQPGERQTQRR